jgi:hypothetical protein
VLCAQGIRSPTAESGGEIASVRRDSSRM